MRFLFALMLLCSMSVFAGDFYAGLNGGWGKFTGHSTPFGNVQVKDLGHDIAGYGGFAGYRITTGKMTTALEVEYQKFSGDFTLNAPNEKQTNGLSHGFIGHLVVGYEYSPIAELYARLGYGKFEAEGKYTLNGATTKADDKFYGYVYAGGIRLKNDSPVSLRLEYRYYDFKEYDLYTSTANIDATVNMLVVGLEYAF